MTMTNYKKNIKGNLENKNYLTNKDFEEHKQELRDAILEKDEINAKYKNENDLKKYPAFNTDQQLLEGEEFKPYKAEPQILVSNLGRIKFGGENGIIAQQIDTKPLAGYLYLKDYKELRNKYNVKLDDDYVYQMVAKTWLELPSESDEKWAIHHISNDGYDNSEANLIWVEFNHHNDIHKK